MNRHVKEVERGSRRNKTQILFQHHAISFAFPFHSIKTLQSTFRSDRKSTSKNKVWRKINTINIMRIKLSQVLLWKEIREEEIFYILQSEHIGELKIGSLLRLAILNWVKKDLCCDREEKHHQWSSREGFYYSLASFS